MSEASPTIDDDPRQRPEHERLSADAAPATEIVAVAMPRAGDTTGLDRRVVERAAEVGTDRRNREHLAVELDEAKLATVAAKPQGESPP